MIKLCKLCEINPVGPESHLIPSFVIKWLKTTSATGYIRQSVNPNLRKQDGIKPITFCTRCETLISNFEKKFSKEIFIPYLSGTKTEFSYDSWLINYIVTQSLRCALFWIDQFSKDRPDLSGEVHNAIKHWKSCLISGHVDNTYQHHLFFATMTEANDSFSDFIFWYLERTIDTVLADKEKEVIAFTLYPKMIIISFISPNRADAGFVNTEVTSKGVISVKNQEISYPGIAGFLNKSAKFVKMSIRNISEKQQKKIDKDTTNNPSRYDSRSFKAWLKMQNKSNDST